MVLFGDMIPHFGLTLVFLFLVYFFEKAVYWMLFNFANVLLILIGGFVFVAINLILSRFLQTRLPSIEKEMPYECGEEPIGDTRIKFNTRFYVIALIFLIFDVEIVFLFPWGVVFRKLIEDGLVFLPLVRCLFSS